MDIIFRFVLFGMVCNAVGLRSSCSWFEKRSDGNDSFGGGFESEGCDGSWHEFKIEVMMLVFDLRLGFVFANVADGRQVAG